MSEELKHQKSKRGFAGMSPERQRQIASQGGQAAHKQGVAHKWSAVEAKEAGKKGGTTSGLKRAQASRSGNNELPGE